MTEQTQRQLRQVIARRPAARIGTREANGHQLSKSDGQSGHLDTYWLAEEVRGKEHPMGTRPWSETGEGWHPDFKVGDRVCTVHEDGRSK